MNTENHNPQEKKKSKGDFIPGFWYPSWRSVILLIFIFGIIAITYGAEKLIETSRFVSSVFWAQRDTLHGFLEIGGGIICMAIALWLYNKVRRKG
jgi:TRAP-type C4-dicarboxylate transport system permease small subunit